MKQVSRILETWFKNFRLREAWFKSNTAPQLYWVRNSLNATVLVDGKARKVESPKSGDLPKYYLEGEKYDPCKIYTAFPTSR